jgi:hypothetical protein
MRKLIRHILKESRLQQELKQVIEDGNIFDAADMVGGLENLKKIFKNHPEISKILDGLTGVVDFEYHDAFKDPRFFVFPIEYEIIGIEKNTWGTHSWPLLNLIYDDSKLTSTEKKKLITILATIQNDNTVGKIETNLPEIKSSSYFDVRQINGKNTDIHDVEFPFSKEDVKRIHDKLYGESESLNESDNREIDKNLRAINVLLSLVSWDGLCDIWAEYNPDDKEYEIRSKTTVRDLYNDEIPKELSSLEDSIKSMGIKVYIYAPWYVDSCDDEVKFMNESSNRSEKDQTKLIKGIIDSSGVFDYKHFCGVDIIPPEERTDQYNFLNKNNVPFLIKVYFIGGPNSKVWPRTQAVRNKELDLMEELHEYIKSFVPFNIEMMASHVNSCDGYNKLMKRKYSTNDLQESIIRILKEEDYSPAGKEVIPNKIVIHKSNPMSRDKIMENGLKVRAGECYKIYVGYGVKCKPAIFATNSTNKRSWFDSTYDDDIWFIDTTKIPDVKWFKDRHFESRSKHIVTFQDIPKEAITLKYQGTGSSEDVLNSWPEDSPNRLQESIRRILRENSLKNDLMESEDKKLKLVQEMIYSLFDEVEFIEVDTNYEGKPLIKVYHDVEDTAANYDNWFTHRIIDEIKEMTGDGVVLAPWWALGWDWKYKNPDIFIGVEKIEYDDEGNVINESDESKQERKFNKLIQNVEDYLNSNEYPSVKKFTVYYEDTHDDVIVNIFFNVEDSIKLGGGINSVIKRVGKQVMEDLEVFPMDFKYYIHFDRDINESEEKQPKYLNIIKDLVEPFKDEVGVCDINVSYDDDDDMYSVYIVMSTEEMNDKFSYVPMIQSHISKLRINVRTTIKDYLPIDNLYVGSYGKPNCNWNPLNESSIKEKSLVKLLEKDGLYDLVEMTGLGFNQVRSLLKHTDNPKEILKQYIRQFVIEDDPNSGENSGVLIGVKIPLSNTKYVNDIMVQDSDQIAVEIIEYHIDEYGHREDKDQYLTTINNLTNDELLSILSWMMETVERGYWF